VGNRADAVISIKPKNIPTIIVVAASNIPSASEAFAIMMMIIIKVNTIVENPLIFSVEESAEELFNIC
jgi:hypothetical protein